MPEGDVLLRVARRLSLALGERPLVRGELRWPSLAGHDLSGLRSVGTVSYGKHLLTRLDDGRTLHTHLRMDGSWQVRHTADPPEPLRRPNVRAVLGTDQWTCVGLQLGMMDLVRTREEGSLLRQLGPDLMADEPDLDRAVANLRAAPERPIGEALLDQSVAAGIGTIYLAETLWAHRINPWRTVSGVNQSRELFETAHRLMRRSADGPALTATGDTRAGHTTHVHGRAGRGCRRCRTLIVVAPIGVEPMTRPAYYCPTCQPD
jgi:endonuclease-8